MNKPSSKYLSVDRLPAFGDVIHGTEMDATHGRISSGQVDNFEAIADGPVVGVAGDDLQTGFNRLVLCDRRRQRPALIADDLGNGIERGTHHACDLRLICDDYPAGGQADSGQRLLNDLYLGHVVLLLDKLEPPFHVNESVSSDAVFLLDLSASDTQQSGDAIRVDSALKNRRDVVETEAQLPQCNDPMQALKLRGIVGTVAAALVDVSWYEQTSGVPMPQHPVGHLADLREGSYG